MEEDKTILEWFKELPENIRELAILRHNQHDGGDVYAPTLPFAMMKGFDWRNSPEKYNFWRKQYLIVIERR